MAIHRHTKIRSMPSITNGKTMQPRMVDPLLDDNLFLTEAELAQLPDPEPMLPAIATLVVEVIAGARSVDHLSKLVTEQVYERLRAKVSQRPKTDSKQKTSMMPKFAITKVRTGSPRPGIIESAVLVTTQQRTRAVAIRLEPVHKRWRATSVSIL